MKWNIVSVLSCLALLVTIIVGFQQIRTKNKNSKYFLFLILFFGSVFLGCSCDASTNKVSAENVTASLTADNTISPKENSSVTSNEDITAPTESNTNSSSEDKVSVGDINIDGDGNDIDIGNNTTIYQTEKVYDEKLTSSYVLNNGTYSSLAVLNNIPFKTMTELALNLENKNDIELKVDNILLNVISFMPCTLDTYAFEHLAGENSSQMFYGKIGESKGLYELSYKGEDANWNDLEKTETSKFLTVESGAIEYLIFNLDYEKSGIYEFNLLINYSGNNNVVLKTETLRMYLPPKEETKYRVNHLDAFRNRNLLNCIEAYYGLKLPEIYFNALMERSKNIDTLSDHNILHGVELDDWEVTIASYYSSYNASLNSLDSTSFIEIYASLLQPFEETENNEYLINKFAIDEMINKANVTTIDWDFDWKTDEKTGDMIIPKRAIDDINPYATIESSSESSDGSIYISGYVYNKKSGQKNFNGVIALEKNQYNISRPSKFSSLNFY